LIERGAVAAPLFFWRSQWSIPVVLLPVQPTSLRVVNPKTSSATAVEGNIHETIASVHDSFAVLFSRLFSRHASNPERSHEKGLSNGTASNRDLLPDRNFLSEIGSALASRILDWTSGACLSS
jgi:hypothetical protein